MDYELEFVPTKEDLDMMIENQRRSDIFFEITDRLGYTDDDGKVSIIGYKGKTMPIEVQKALKDLSEWMRYRDKYCKEKYPDMEPREVRSLIVKSQEYFDLYAETFLSDSSVPIKAPSRLPAVSEFTNTYAMTFLLRVLATGDAPTPVGKESIRSSDYKGVRSIVYKSRKQSVGIYLSNYDGIFKSGKLMTKWFIYLMQQAGRQGFGASFTFSLQEVVDLKMYKEKDSAWEAFNEQFMVMQGGITIAVSKTALTEDAATHGFFGAHTRNGDIVTVYFNSDFSAELFTQYFTVLPRFAYSLSTRACLMLTYICSRARQSYEDLKEGEPYTFTVSIQALCEFIGLPKIEEVKNSRYNQQIITPFKKLMDEIKKAQDGNPDCDDFHIDLDLKTITNAGIIDWMGGDVEVTMTGTITDLFSKVATKKAKKIKKIQDATAKEIAKRSVEKKTSKTVQASE